jgi:hypothetical protein
MERMTDELREQIMAAHKYLDSTHEPLSQKANDWTQELDERQQKELKLARLYAKDFAHGTDGHHRLLLIAKLADLLDKFPLK